MATMILKMSVSTALFIAITAILWRFWNKHGHALGMKVLVGVIFGLCSVAATHFGVDYKDMILNVRDMGPLAAGLFFDPVSGIISGLIGGLERYYAGTYLGVGTFTTAACSLSTCLAGFLSAGLNIFLFKGKRPQAMFSFFIGAVMEVFHMYAVLFTNRDSMFKAYHVVKHCSVPMIVFSGIGMACCSLLVKYFSGEFTKRVPLSDREHTPIAKRFHRWLLLVTLSVLVVNTLIDNGFRKRAAYQETVRSLTILASDCKHLYADMAKSPERAQELMPYIAMAMSSDAVYLIYNSDQEVIASLYSKEAGMDHLSDGDYEIFSGHAGRGIYRASPSFYGELDSLCITEQLDDDLYLTVGWRYDSIGSAYENQMYENLLSDILLFTVLYTLIALLVDTLVVRNLRSVNRSLQKIIGGDLNEVVNVRESQEFSYLSDDINQTVTTLKGYIDESEKRMEEELKLAAFIQESALPHVFTFPRRDFEIFAIMDPARQVGGDFYDFFFTNVDTIALVIADVSGKGIPAAMFMMRAKTAIVNSARKGNMPAEVLSEVNNILCEGNEAEMFVSVWIGLIDLRTGLMKCSNAGHEYPVICRSGEEYELMKDPHGLVLAAMSDVPMKEYEIQLYPGDRIFVYTDGVPEAIDKGEKQYGTGRLVVTLNTLLDADEEETLHTVHQDIMQFAGEAEQFDDITMIGFTYFGETKPNES